MLSPTTGVALTAGATWPELPGADAVGAAALDAGPGGDADRDGDGDGDFDPAETARSLATTAWA